MKEIPLTQGKIAYVDDEDFERTSNLRWWVHRCTGIDYAARHIRIEPKKYRNELLHRFILNVTDRRVIVDHIDGNGLNCTRSNLRIAYRSGNQQNARRKSNNKSGYKGVHKRADGQNKWAAQIRNDQGKKIYLGSFDNPIDAAKAYDEAARKYHGEFAKTNF